MKRPQNGDCTAYRWVHLDQPSFAAYNLTIALVNPQIYQRRRFVRSWCRACGVRIYKWKWWMEIGRVRYFELYERRRCHHLRQSFWWVLYALYLTNHNLDIRKSRPRFTSVYTARNRQRRLGYYQTPSSFRGRCLWAGYFNFRGLQWPLFWRWSSWKDNQYSSVYATKLQTPLHG